MAQVNTANLEAIQDHLKDSDGNKNGSELFQKSKDFLISKTANQVLKDAKERPMPDPLYRTLWFEGEICILFGDTGVGKSILSTQIAHEISLKRLVQLYDFELSEKQYQLRYTREDGQLFNFSDNLIRVWINDDYDFPDDTSIETLLMESIEKHVVQTGCKVLIIDNITYLSHETEKAKNALPLMKKLKQIKSRHNLSILVLAHTPKRDSSRPITKNDLGGSKMLINFCDSAFAIGESEKDSNIRYLKQIKVRNTAVEYGSDNVIVMEIEKEGAFLKFNNIDYSSEQDHLTQISEADKVNLESSIIDLYKRSPDLSLQNIADKLDTNKAKVYRVLKKYGEQNQQK